MQYLIALRSIRNYSSTRYCHCNSIPYPYKEMAISVTSGLRVKWVESFGLISVFIN